MDNANDKRQLDIIKECLMRVGAQRTFAGCITDSYVDGAAKSLLHRLKERHPLPRQTFTVVIEEDESTYATKVLELSGCFSEGDTLRSALDNTADAIAVYLEAQGHDVDVPRTDLSF